MTNYLFKNKSTGEIRRGTGFSLNNAARCAGLDVPYRGELPAPWVKWEYWDGPDNCVWHYDDAGNIHDGPRPT